MPHALHSRALLASLCKKCGLTLAAQKSSRKISLISGTMLLLDSKRTRMTDLLPGLKKRLEKTNLANPFEGEEKEKVRATKVKGLGEEAFWSAGKMGGVLYGLKHQIIVRIGFGIQRPGTALSANKLRQCNTFSVDLFPGGTRRFWLWRRKGKPAVIFRYWAAKNDSVHEETLTTESPINLQRAVKT